jgi:hypothetical protein
MARLRTSKKISLKPPLLHSRKKEKYRMESLLKDFLVTLTEASYQVAVKCGFRGSFVVFLSDFQEAVEKVLKEDRIFPTKSFLDFEEERRHRRSQKDQSWEF